MKAKRDNNELQHLRERNAELEASNASLSSSNDLLEHRVQALLLQLYGKKSERKQDDHPQLPFPEDDVEPPAPPHVGEAPDEEFEEITYVRKKRGAPRISKDLPREVVVLDVAAADRLCPCCEEEMQEIGKEVSERIDFTPAVLKVIETVRPKYACKKHEEQGVLTAEPPIHPIAKGMATAGLLANVLVAKYKDHLPLYRQSRIFARYGAEIPESSLCDWVKHGAGLLDPIVMAMKSSVLESPVVGSDDTGITVLDRNRQGGSRRSFLWAYVGDRNEVVFDFTAGRGREGPRAFLGNYQGTLQVDAYAGYAVIFATGRVIEAGCWAHARRRFFKALDSVDKQLAAHAIAVIRRLYEIERQAKEHNLDHAARRELRQLDAKPLLDAMQPWLSALQSSVLPKSPLGEAIRYTLRQWDALTRFLEDGRVAIDNNLVERQMRTVAVGRKNWMFAGSPEGGRRAAIIYSLTCTCGLLGIEPWAYLKDVLQRIAEGEDPAFLTPRLWMAARGDGDS